MNGEDIRDESYVTELQVNSKQEIEVALRNSENRMAKNIEFGISFPTNFIIDKMDYYSIYRDEEKQIIRYEKDIVHGNTIHFFEPLIITPLAEDEYKIRTFIKAENIESTYRYITIKVT